MASSTIRKREIRTALRERADAWHREFFRHELLTARYVRGVQLEAEADFQRRVVRPLLMELPAKLAAVRARGDDYTRDMFPALSSMLDDISRTIEKGADATGKLTAKRMAEIAEREVEWTASALKRAAPAVKAEVGREISKDTAGEAAQGTKDRLWLGDSTERWFKKDIGEKTGDAVRRTITTAQKHGLSVDGTVQLLRGTKGQAGILAEKPVYTIRGLVRSAATHASSEGRMASYRALGVTHWRFVATLDQRTCFAAGTLVRMASGHMMPIEELRYGDIIESGSGTARRVTGTAHRPANDWMRFRMSDGSSFECTPNHPFWTGHGWAAAESLLVGQVLGVRGMRGDVPHGARNEDAEVLLDGVWRGGPPEEGHVSVRGVRGEGDASRGERAGAPCCGEGARPAPTGWVSVASVERFTHTAECYDIEVEHDHCFLIEGGLIAHNSLQCASEDGGVYPLDEGPIPPLHVNCRSSVAPVIEGMEPFGTRASIKGPVSAKTNFEEWLGQLPADEQEMVLGKTKAAAWRAGKLTLKQMLGADLQPLTLAELGELDRL